MRGTNDAREEAPRPVCLIILDGFGVAAEGGANAITVARTPNYDSYIKNYPQTTLGASGVDVGLPVGQMGNSEVGHLNMGAGRIVPQELTRINQAIEDRSFFANSVLTDAVRRVWEAGSTLHIMGLLSDGGVHSLDTHLFALLKLAKEAGLPEVNIHAFLDGRDTLPRSALQYVDSLEHELQGLGVGRIATVCGRYYAMDRDHRWERVKEAYDALVHGVGLTALTAAAAVEQSYVANIGDEFVKPTIISADQSLAEGGQIGPDDVVIFFNFRADRARELTEALTTPRFIGFDRGDRPPRPHFVCLTQYDDDCNLQTVFAPQTLKNILAEVVSDHGLTQLHIAETEKYAHVTFFFNGGLEEPLPGEERILIPSPKVATYDLRPEMSAFEVAERTAGAVRDGGYDLIVVNFANADMVGHTGMLDAAVEALEAVDMAVLQVVEAVLAAGGVAVITADHGNVEQMVEDDGDPWTAHTLSRVPLILAGAGSVGLKEGARLADIAPTILALMGLPIPAEMSGDNLLDTR